ncbi:MAG: UDP-N-acetylmuramoyl-L-alanyl-D-glutamate--2,6-diaminopimelate ligase [Oscillospiraceae bacterium]|nr:UDP-N-acetylmuramoyl-L-alanyl-D-glutamate--2,6-diaminopimelate ligase [Oscillospiraceae bacterium]
MELLDVFEKYKITNVTDDTRNVSEGSLFVAIKGDNFDGELSAAKMLSEKGAAAVITQNDLGLERQVIVENARLAYAQAVSLFYGNPTSKLKLIAVTGTNGKSTVATLIKAVLEKNAHKTGFIGTTCYDVCNPCGKVYEAKLSTPRQDELYRLFAEMVENNAEYCVMEASSQALDQFRIAGESFETGVFTNLTQDHLDWHKTMENYYKAKKSLFYMCKSAVICVDDKYGKRLAGELRKELNMPITTYSINELADVYGVNIKTSSGGVSYWFSDSKAEKSFPFKFKMPGIFNVANSMAAVAACRMLGNVGGEGLKLSVEECITALEGCPGVRGRCEVIHDGEFTVICDYAHTEDALVKILTCVRDFAARRIICLFGAAGERDADKRPSMGATAAKYADFLIITSDNPRFEEPEKIISEVKEGIPKIAPPCVTFVDRHEAIKFAVAEAEKGDIVLLCGKGHETYQVIGDDYTRFDEREIVAQLV